MMCAVSQKLTQHKGSILSLWLAAALPQGSVGLAKETAHTRFAAPADYVLKDETEALFDWFISGNDIAAARPHVVELCKLKAVQATTPSKALGFIFELKSIIRLVFANQSTTELNYSEGQELDRRIDELMLLAFDEYAECREHLMEVRIAEIQRLAGRGR